MIPGPPALVTCPACGAQHHRESLISSNTIGASFYSDGKMVAAMSPDFPIFTKCHSCSALFKITNENYKRANRLEWGCYCYSDDGPIYGGGSKAPFPFVRFLEIDEYIAAIEQGLCNSAPKGSEEYNEDLTSLRRLLWWAFNDEFCDSACSIWSRRICGEGQESSGVEAITDPRYLDNCRAMLAETSEDGADDPTLLQLAEIHRNIGEFDESIWVLDKVSDKVKYMRYISAITEECAAQNRKTVIVD